jgi:hypothetical protein
LTVGRLARLAGLSPYHFIQAFRAHAGQTPHQYLRARRIERAKELRPDVPRRPLTAISEKQGRPGDTAPAEEGVLGSGVFHVDDCHKTYEDLKKKGVQFAPEDRFYGVEAIMKDGLGNWFSMTQAKAWQG